jgi:hypothetical protein
MLSVSLTRILTSISRLQSIAQPLEIIVCKEIVHIVGRGLYLYLGGFKFF